MKKKQARMTEEMASVSGSLQKSSANNVHLTDNLDVKEDNPEDDFFNQFDACRTHSLIVKQQERQLTLDVERIQDITDELKTLKRQFDQIEIVKVNLEGDIEKRKAKIEKHMREAEFARTLCILRNKFPFEKLPPEIRNTILELALVEPEPILVNPPREWHNQFPAVLVHSPQMRKEAGSIYYGKNTFDFANSSCLWLYLKSIDDQMASFMRHITVKWDHLHSVFAYKQLRRCTGLDTLRFRFEARSNNIFGMRRRKDCCITTTQGLVNLVKCGQKFRVVEVIWDEDDSWIPDERVRLKTIKKHLVKNLTKE